ncbi:MAG TPA: hypothetical protein VNO26_05200 [Candidatus Limnocylindria bacterium]|nr:hypothetical protein [Candidatus Limnocylindria bacterium]
MRVTLLAVVWLAALGRLAHAGSPTTTTTVNSTTTTIATTTTTLVSTTSTTAISTTSSTSTSLASSTSTSTSSTTSTTASTVPPVEQCGNCRDDDGDGLTDYEDADCCAAPPGTLTVERLTLLPIGAVTRVQLAAVGLPAVPTLVPSTQTLVLQLAADDAEPFVCAEVHALHFRSKPDRATFVDRTSGVPGARGLTSIGLRRLGTGALRLTARGARARFYTPAAERIRVTAALRLLVAPGTPVRCVTRTVNVVRGKNGRFELP